MKNEMAKTMDVANRYNVSREAVRLWHEQGMPVFKIGPKTFRYNLDEVDAWLRDRANSRSKIYKEGRL